MVVPKFDEEVRRAEVLKRVDSTDELHTQTAAYWTDDERLGQRGTWNAIKSRDPRELSPASVELEHSSSLTFLIVQRRRSALLSLL